MLFGILFIARQGGDGYIRQGPDGRFVIMTIAARGRRGLGRRGRLRIVVIVKFIIVVVFTGRCRINGTGVVFGRGY